MVLLPSHGESDNLITHKHEFQENQRINLPWIDNGSTSGSDPLKTCRDQL